MPETTHIGWARLTDFGLNGEPSNWFRAVTGDSDWDCQFKLDSYELARAGIERVVLPVGVFPIPATQKQK